MPIIIPADGETRDKNEQHIKVNKTWVITYFPQCIVVELWDMYCVYPVGLTAFPYLPHMQNDLSMAWIVMVTGHIGVFVCLQYLTFCHLTSLLQSELNWVKAIDCNIISSHNNSRAQRTRCNWFDCITGKSLVLNEVSPERSVSHKYLCWSAALSKIAH